MPGPACYGSGGTEPTNTDANLVLGILPERGLLGGRKPLSLELARQAIRTHIAEPLGLTVEDAAAAIYAVQNAQTGDLLRKTVVEAGHDPRDFVALRLRRCRARALRGLRRRGGRHARSSCRWGRWRRRSPPTGSRPRTSSLAAELSDPAVVPVRPGPRGANFAGLRPQVRDALDRQGVQFSDGRAAPRDRHAVLDAARRARGPGAERPDSTTP